MVQYDLYIRKRSKNTVSYNKNQPMGQESVKVEDTLITASQSWELFDKDLQ